jgi:S1-C subfamily serine protease
MASSPRKTGSARAATDALLTSASAALGDVKAAKEAWSARLLEAPAAAALRASSAGRVSVANAPQPQHNVVGVGIAEKLVEGTPTGVLCVKFFVRQKYPKASLARGETLPSEVDGVPTDVEEVGVFRKLATKRRTRRAARIGAQPAAMPNPRVRIRPAPPGSSIGYRDPANAYIMAGTFGAVVRKGSRTYILSNNHVLADENRLPLASPIFQPGLLDHGSTTADKIAQLAAFVPLVASGNAVDAAIALVTTPTLVTRNVMHIGAPKAKKLAAIDMIVHKFGRTTSYTAGRVTSIDTDVSVQYDTGTFTFLNQVIIRGLNGSSFSNAGDSGSLILERGTNRAVGLLFAGSAAYTIANHISQVLAQLGGVTLA